MPERIPSVGSRRITELDGWRGISVLCVVIGHVINVRYSANPGLEPTNLPGVLSAFGVDVFFVISGFIITRLAIEERADRGYFSIARFYTRRIFRIIPAFYFYLFSIAVFAQWGLIEQPGYDTAVATTFVCNVPHAPCGWFAAHSWTLSFEEQFYLTFPLIFYFGGRGSTKILPAIFVALLLFPFARYALHLTGAWRIASDFCPSFSFICVGAVSAAHEPIMRRLATGRHNAAISAIAAGFVVALGACNSIVSLPLNSPESYVQASLTIVLLPVCLAWTVLSLVYRDSPLSALLRNRLVQFLGLISYSLYLWQQVFTAAASHYLVDSWLMFPPLMLVAAMLSYYCIERPCIRAGRQLMARGRAPPIREPGENEKAIAG